MTERIKGPCSDLEFYALMVVLDGRLSIDHIPDPPIQNFVRFCITDTPATRPREEFVRRNERGLRQLLSSGRKVDIGEKLH